MTAAAWTEAIVSTLAVGDATVTLTDNAAVADASWPTVVIVHGTGGSTHAHFWALYPMLATRYRVVGVDYDPLPESATPLTVAALADQVATVIKTLADGTRVHLLGYSLGAVVAVQTAARADIALASLTLVSGWARTDVHQRLRIEAWRRLGAASPEAMPDLLLTSAHSAIYLRQLHDYQLRELQARYRDRRDARKENELNLRVDVRDETAAITVPTLIVGGALDAMVGAHHSRELFGAIADARYLEIPAGHAIPAERPAELFAAVDDFITDPSGHPAGSRIQPARI